MLLSAKKYSNEDFPLNVRITNNRCNEKECITQLIITEIDVSNVGEYSCHYTDSLENLNFDQINSIYVYVSGIFVNQLLFESLY